MQKKVTQKPPTHQDFIKLENPHCRPIPGPSWHKNLKTMFFLIEVFNSISKLYATVVPHIIF